MDQRRIRGVLLALLVLAGAGCAPQVRLAASYEEYFVAACAAFDGLFGAVGSPDTGTGSDLSDALDAAVASGDGASAERAAAEMAKLLKAGREHAAVAAGWTPRKAVMVEFDRVLAAYEVGTAAKLAVAKRQPNAADPQAAFEQAGGLEAWFAMIDAMRAAGLGAVNSANRQCTNSITP